MAARGTGQTEEANMENHNPKKTGRDLLGRFIKIIELVPFLCIDAFFSSRHLVIRAAAMPNV